jgi:hypothetical protein
MQYSNRTISLGDLISALYEEVSKLTANKTLQTKLVYLTLIDMQITSKRSR